jgi:hypothetical protein
MISNVGRDNLSVDSQTLNRSIESNILTCITFLQSNFSFVAHFWQAELGMRDEPNIKLKSRIPGSSDPTKGVDS